VYDRYSKLLFDQRPLLVYGRVCNDEGALSVEVSKLEVLGKRDVGETANPMGFDALRFAAGM
jgi:hypothetical protein